MEKESILKSILLSIVILYHVDWLKWLAIISPKPNEALDEFPVIRLETLYNCRHSLSIVKGIVRLDDFCSHEEVKVYFLTEEILDNCLPADGVERIEFIFSISREFSLYEDWD